MSILNSGQVIKNARLQAGLTQSELSEGICSTVALSKIENGKIGVSPCTFSLLMEKCGVPCETLPTFKDIDDYNCYNLIKKTHNLIKHYQLDEAYACILEIAGQNFSNNKYYLQQTMLLYCWLQYCSYNYGYDDLSKTILQALRITNPAINDFDIRDESLSFVEYKGILLLINLMINNNKLDEALILLSEINVFLSNIKESDHNSYNRQLTYILEITYAKYHYVLGDYSEALSHIDAAIAIYHSDHISDFLAYELFIIKELIDSKVSTEKKLTKKCDYLLAAAWFKGCLFINQLISHIENDFESSYAVSEYTLPEKHFEKISFTSKKLSDGFFNIYDKNVITVGKLVKHLRTQQKISLDKLCYGLCSKSMLSKIENNTLSPNIYLIEALLGRLGIPERELTFYGNAEETEYSALRLKVVSASHSHNREMYSEAVDSFSAFAEKTGNKIVIQLAEVYKTTLLPKKEDSYEPLLNAIRLTCPDFSIDNMNNFLLSRDEYSIANGILKSIYHDPDIFKTSFIFHRILTNTDSYPLNNKQFSQGHAGTITLFLIFLDINKMYTETVLFVQSILSKVKLFNPYIQNIILYYFAIAKASLNQRDDLEVIAKASIGNAYISNDTGIITSFKNDINNLSGIKI